MMRIIIPTRGRMDEQRTFSVLPRELRKRTTIVCPEKEKVRLSCLDVEVVAQPDPNWKIAQKREWIVREWLHRGCDKIIMLDDDLSFATRISTGGTGLRTIRGKVLIPEFELIEEKLGPEYPHVGFGPRQGNNHEEGDWKYNDKMICALGYYLPIVAKEARWDLVELREDMCVTLQLLLKGYPNAIWTRTVVDQRFDAAGGCSAYRTVEMNNAEAEKLKRLFPEYVSLDWKEYKNGSRRIEPHCQWKIALRNGLEAGKRGKAV
jgi:hypothetical protein